MKVAEKKLSEKQVSDMCLCPSCPSYLDECKDKAFCYPAGGKSKCIKKEQGCICPGCPVQSAMNYTRVYYCTRGSDVEQFS